MKMGTMKKSLFGFSALAALTLAASANAALVVTVNPGVVSGSNTIYTVAALNDGIGGTGTKLLAFDATITTTGTTAATRIIVKKADTNFDGTADVDVLGATISGGTGFGTGGGSYMRIGSAGGTTLSPIGGVDPDPYQTTSDSDGNLVTDVNAAYSNLHSFHMVGLNANGITANSGTGALFANIVVPTGTTGTFAGTVGGDTGDAIAFSVPFPPVPAPEPTSLAVLGVAGLGMLGNRRRRA